MSVELTWSAGQLHHAAFAGWPPIVIAGNHPSTRSSQMLRKKNTQVRSSRRFAQNFPAWWSWTLRACRCLPPLFGSFPTHWLSCKTHNCFWMNVQDSVQNAPAIKTPWIGLSLSAPRRFMLYAVYICICICVCIYIYIHIWIWNVDL